MIQAAWYTVIFGKNSDSYAERPFPKSSQSLQIAAAIVLRQSAPYMSEKLHLG